jgi:hypothetical protein
MLYLFRSGGDDTFGNMAEIIKIAVVPVVTLVIGYYFGSTKSE